MSEANTPENLKAAVKALEKPTAQRLWRTVIPVIALMLVLYLLAFAGQQSGIPISEVAIVLAMALLALFAGRFLERRFHGIQSMLLLYRLEQDLQQLSDSDIAARLDDLYERFQALVTLIEN